MNVYLIVAACVILGAFGQLLMKKGMNVIGLTSVKDILSLKLLGIVLEKHVFLGIFLYLFASALWLAALSMEEVSKIYPLIGTGYILTAILAFVFLKENITLMRIIGTVLISIGAFLVITK